MPAGIGGAFTVHVCSKTREDGNIQGPIYLPWLSFLFASRATQSYGLIGTRSGFRKRGLLDTKKSEGEIFVKNHAEMIKRRNIVSKMFEFQLHLSGFQASFDYYNLTLFTSLVEIPVFSPPYPPLPSPPL